MSVFGTWHPAVGLTSSSLPVSLESVTSPVVVRDVAFDVEPLPLPRKDADVLTNSPVARPLARHFVLLVERVRIARMVPALVASSENSNVTSTPAALPFHSPFSFAAVAVAPPFGASPVAGVSLAGEVPPSLELEQPTKNRGTQSNTDLGNVGILTSRPCRLEGPSATDLTEISTRPGALNPSGAQPVGRRSRENPASVKAVVDAVIPRRDHARLIDQRVNGSVSRNEALLRLVRAHLGY